MPAPTSNAQIKAEVIRLRKAKKKVDAEKAEILRSRNRMLIAGRKERAERIKLTKELADLKNPRSAAFKKNVLRAGRGFLKGFLAVGDDLERRRQAAVGKGKRR